MTAVEALRKELGEKVDGLSSRLDAMVTKESHDEVRRDQEERLRELERFKAYALGAMAVLSGVAGLVGAVVARALH